MAKNTAKAANDYRYERKFFISELTLAEAISIIKLHPAIFREIYHARYVNNIYFDTLEMKSYFENVDGTSDRTKIRIRWYGNLFGLIEKPVIELKIKKGLLGTKSSYALNSFSLDSDFNSEILTHVFQTSDIPDVLRLRLMLLKPTLMNRYSRLYYRSADGDYRLTLDNDMEFYSINEYQNLYLHKYSDINNIVLELKYDHDKTRHAKQITNHFPFRMMKNSKYLNGIDSLAI